MDMVSQCESTYPPTWPDAPGSSDWNGQENVGWNWADFEKLTFDPSVEPEPDSHGTVLDGEHFDEPMLDTSVDPEHGPYGTTLNGLAPVFLRAPPIFQNDGVSHGLVGEDAQLLAQPAVVPPPPSSSMVAVPGTARQRGTWWQRESVTPDDWEDVRPFFVQLYIEENVKLKDVMAILAKRLNFNASMKMYKTQIPHWGLGKNYKASEKEHIALVLKDSDETGRATALLKIRGRPVQLHRVRRHCKKQGSLPAVFNNALAALSEADRSEVDSWIKSRGGRLIPVRRPECHQKLLSLTTTNDRIELVLKQTEIYLENASLTINTNDVNPSKTWTFRDKVWKAGSLMAAGKFDAGCCELGAACELAHEVLVESAMSFLRHVVSWCYHPAYRKFPEARLHVLRFLARLSAARLGTRHPLSVALFHMLDDGVSSDMIRPAFEVMKDTTLRIRAIDNAEVVEIQLDQVVYLAAARNDLQAAESVCLQCVEFCVNSFGRNALYTESALMQLGRIYERRGCYDDAITVFQDVLSRRSRNGSEPDSMDVSATRDLARVYVDLGDAKQSVEH